MATESAHAGHTIPIVDDTTIDSNYTEQNCFRPVILNNTFVEGPWTTKYRYIRHGLVVPVWTHRGSSQSGDLKRRSWQIKMNLEIDHSPSSNVNLPWAEPCWSKAPAETKDCFVRLWSINRLLHGQTLPPRTKKGIWPNGALMVVFWRRDMAWTGVCEYQSYANLAIASPGKHAINS